MVNGFKFWINDQHPIRWSISIYWIVYFFSSSWWKKSKTFVGHTLIVHRSLCIVSYNSCTLRFSLLLGWPDAAKDNLTALKEQLSANKLWHSKEEILSYMANEKNNSILKSSATGTFSMASKSRCKFSMRSLRAAIVESDWSNSFSKRVVDVRYICS